jgi:hypothetical protein
LKPLADCHRTDKTRNQDITQEINIFDLIQRINNTIDKNDNGADLMENMRP